MGFNFDQINKQTGGGVKWAQSDPQVPTSPIDKAYGPNVYGGGQTATAPTNVGTVPIYPTTAPNQPIDPGGIDRGAQPAPQPSSGITRDGIYDYALNGVNNLGIGQKPPTVTDHLTGYNAWLSGQGNQMQVNPVAVNPIGVPSIGAPPQAQAGQVGAPPAIQAPVAQSAQIDLGDAGQFQKALYESIYRPVDRELSNQLVTQNREAQARLSNAGLIGSGVEQAVLGQIRDENSRQKAAAMYDASNQATIQRFGYEFQTKVFNAQQEQTVRLANANFNLQAQITTSQNILQAGIANAQFQTQASIANAGNATQTNIAQAQLGAQVGIANAQMSYNSQVANNQAALQQQQQYAQQYYQLLGLSAQQGQAATDDFLQLLQISLGDLQQLDKLDFDLTALALNTYLQELGIIVSAGGGAGSKGTGTSSGFGVNGGITGGSQSVPIPGGA